MTESVTRLPSREWVIGWKVAQLVARADTGELAFWQMHRSDLSNPYSFDTVAECNQTAEHQAPDPDCRCGFNAFEARQDAVDYFARTRVSPLLDGIVVLRVGLCGEVFEGLLDVPGEFVAGYRASRQVVADVFLSPRCYLCEADLSSTEPAVIVCPDLFIDAGKLWSEVRSFCASCEPAGFQRYTTADLPPNTALHWLDQPLDEPDDPRTSWLYRMQPDSAYMLAVLLTSRSEVDLKWVSAVELLNYCTEVNRAIQLYRVIREAQLHDGVVVQETPAPWWRFWRRRPDRHVLNLT